PTTVAVRADRGLVPEHAVEPPGTGGRHVRRPRGLRRTDDVREHRRVLLRRPTRGRGSPRAGTASGRDGHPAGDPPRVHHARRRLERPRARPRGPSTTATPLLDDAEGPGPPSDAPRHPDGAVRSNERGPPARHLPTDLRRLFADGLPRPTFVTVAAFKAVASLSTANVDVRIPNAPGPRGRRDRVRRLAGPPRPSKRPSLPMSVEYPRRGRRGRRDGGASRGPRDSRGDHGGGAAAGSGRCGRFHRKGRGANSLALRARGPPVRPHPGRALCWERCGE